MTMGTKSCERCGNSFQRKRKYSDSQWQSAKYCSRHCGAWNLGLTKTDDPRLLHIAECVRVSSKGRPGWSKGLTKETHPSLMIVSRKVSVTQKGKTINQAQREALERGRFDAKGRSKETCPIIAIRGIKLSNILRGRKNPIHSARMKALYEAEPHKHPNAIVAKKTKGKGYTDIERAVAAHLDRLGIVYGFNVRIGTKWPDFSIPSHSLLIEADEEYWHKDASKDAARDVYLKSLGWRIVHISGSLIRKEPARCFALIQEAINGG